MVPIHRKRDRLARQATVRLWITSVAFARETQNSTHDTLASTLTPPPLPPILLGLALHRRRGRVLELEPIAAAAGSVARAEPLADDAFETHGAGVAKDGRGVILDVLIEPNTEPVP